MTGPYKNSKTSSDPETNHSAHDRMGGRNRKRLPFNRRGHSTANSANQCQIQLTGKTDLCGAQRLFKLELKEKGFM
jgi:hypothetical protein